MKHFFREHKAELTRILATAAALAISMWGIWKYVLPFDFVAIAATLIGGFPMFKEAFEALKVRRMTMELSMCIAVLATMLIKQFSTGLVITLFVLIAEFLEHLTVERGRNVLKKLAELMPQFAIVRRNGQETQVLAEELHSGDIVIVKPGSRIPVDGVIARGNSYVDQSAITGEPIPVEKQTGATVLAGTVNQSGVLEINATGIGKDTTFGKIIDVISVAQQSQAPIEKTADKLSARLVYFAFAGAALTYIYSQNITATISALIVAGACGVAAGTPLAILAGIGRTAREGIIVKGGVHLEQLAHANTVVLDKTGTLTLGKPTVTDIVSFNGISEEAVLQLLATAEQHSGHPLATAVMQKAKEEKIVPGLYDNIEFLHGKGLHFTIDGKQYFLGNRLLLEEQHINYTDADQWLDSKKGKDHTMVLLSSDRELLGGVSISDMIRPEAKQAMADIRHYRMRTVLLSGDNSHVVKATGKALGLTEAIGDLLPVEKLEYIKALKAKGKKVVMIGDGINDAPALMEAHVGIAMGGGTDIASESASMILTTNDLRKVATAIAISRQCMGVIRFNFWGTMAVDAVGMLLAALGYLSPMGAAMIHVGSELLFISNSARLFSRISYIGRSSR